LKPLAAAAPVEFASERLLVRSIRESDLELYCQLFCDRETMRYIGPPWTRTAAVRAFHGAIEATRSTPPRAQFLTLTTKDAQQPVGLCTLQNFDPFRRQIELGVMLVSAGREQGLATEALIAVIAHAFATLSVDEVWVRFAIDHLACERLALSVGLVRYAAASPEDLAANLWRWSACRGAWRS
jgi:RimJ/RimL family protein N-acetyltransferase